MHLRDLKDDSEAVSWGRLLLSSLAAARHLQDDSFYLSGMQAHRCECLSMSKWNRKRAWFARGWVEQQALATGSVYIWCAVAKSQSPSIRQVAELESTIVFVVSFQIIQRRMDGNQRPRGALITQKCTRKHWHITQMLYSYTRFPGYN